MPPTLLTLLTASPSAAPAGRLNDISNLFVQSFDPFTVILLLGSVAAGAVIIRCLFEIRESAILPPSSTTRLTNLVSDGSIEELESFVSRDASFASRVLAAALSAPRTDKHAIRDAAELAATEQSSSWFRKIEPLNIIGNLGPLLGLAGTVWGMVLAFSELGAAGGNANPASLSGGISKALFHTLLGLLLAIPALTFFGFYRQIVDRLCTRAIAVSASLTEKLIARLLPTDAASPRATPNLEPVNAR